MGFSNALLSVSDKTGIVELVLAEQKGTEIVSTGGTMKLLRDHGIPKVVSVSEQTGFEEVMDGRVKTLHPKIHMALLSRVDHAGDTETLNKFGIQPFDLVVGNLYPFEQALWGKILNFEMVELIDIGGPSFLRASAKNYQRIAVVCDPMDYQKNNV